VSAKLPKAKGCTSAKSAAKYVDPVLVPTSPSLVTGSAVWEVVHAVSAALDHSAPTCQEHRRIKTQE